MEDESPAVVTGAEARRGRRRRSGRQRLFLTVGVAFSLVAFAAAGVAAWVYVQYRGIDRTDVRLDEARGGPENYLVVGSDSRAGGDPDRPGRTAADRAPLADTMMIVRIDPSRTAATVLSLPRDLWVTRPDGQEGRLNSAYGAGPQPLIDTIRRELDIPVHHYVEIDFQGFQEVVGAIGGVPMWFDRALRDRNSGLDIAHPGCVTLDGTSALAFARARHLQYYEDGRFRSDGTGDLGRISRQQVFMRRVIDQATAKGLRNPLTLRRVVQAGVHNVTLDSALSLDDLLALGKRFASFDAADLHTLTLPVVGRTTSGGAQVVDLDRTAAQPILARFRSPADPDRAGAGSAPVTTVPAATVEVAVLNASGIEGRAHEVAATLTAAGFTVTGTGNGSELGHPSEAHTVVRYRAGHEAEAATVAAAIGHGVTVEAATDLGSAPVVAFLGRSDRPAAGSSTTTTAPATTTTTPATDPTATIGIVPGDPPPGRSCG